MRVTLPVVRDGLAIPTQSLRRRGADLWVVEQLEPGEVVGLVGPSGSGKSTLFKCLGAMLTPTAGFIALSGTPVFEGVQWLRTDLTRLRREQIGFIFQSP